MLYENKKRNDSELLPNSRGSHLRAIRIKTYVVKYLYISLLPERYQATLQKNISANSYLRARQIKTYVGKYPYICLLPERPVTKRHCKKIYRQIVIYKQDTK